MKKASKVSTDKRKRSPASHPVEKDFLIAGVGASAGGYEAFAQMVKQLPAQPGLAFVLVQHLDPHHESKLTDLLSRDSALPVMTIRNGMRVEPNHIYVMPENCQVEVNNRVLRLSPRARSPSRHMAVDTFFNSLAEDQTTCAVGIVLSGSGTDGTLGLKKIKVEGGITFAQDNKSATFKNMPASAIASGCVDFVLPPPAIARELMRIAKHPALKRKRELQDETDQTADSELAKVFSLVRNLHGVDFSYYKPNTLKRRIYRRMVLKKTEHLGDYVQFLRQNPTEADELFHDMLINVTTFFRDPPMYQALRKRIFPKIIKENAGQSPIRIWVPGCSSGEEAYSLAMALFEFMGRNAQTKNVQIFATDLSEEVLTKARAGIYAESISNDLPAERLRRFFRKVDGGYQIAKFIRDCCIFARQNVIEDPPFSKLDLISCRNVLIYFSPVLQKKVMPIFHYALKRHGHLVLGNSETIGLFADLFTLVDKKNKIYTKRETHNRPEVGFTPRAVQSEIIETIHAPQHPRNHDGGFDLQRHVDRLLLSQYAPAGVVINRSMDVLQFRGQTNAFIEHFAGDASLSLMKMVKPELLVDLRTAIARATKTDSIIRKEEIPLQHDGKERLASLQVIPFRTGDSNERFFLILFEEKPARDTQAEKSKRPLSSKSSERELRRLRDDLISTKESLQAIIEEQEATNEELKSANEEIQSANEELQSTNEELETAKEELQSTNEELTTLNEELQNRNVELTQVNNDLNNLLGSVNMPILMLGNDLTIRRFTPVAERFFNLISTDVGRSIRDINSNILLPDFDQRVNDVLDTLRTQEFDVQDRDGRWFSLRIRPYRTVDNKIDGAVIMLVDINELKRGLEEVTEIVHQPLLILHGDLMVYKTNEAFLNLFQMQRADAEGKSVYNMDEGAWNISLLKNLLEGILPEKHRVENYEIKHSFPRIGEKKLFLSCRRFFHHGKGTQIVLLAINDRP